MSPPPPASTWSKCNPAPKIVHQEEANLFAQKEARTVLQQDDLAIMLLHSMMNRTAVPKASDGSVGNGQVDVAANDGGTVGRKEQWHAA